MKYLVSPRVPVCLLGILFFIIVVIDRMTKSAAIALFSGVDWHTFGACTMDEPCCLLMGSATGPCLSFDLVVNRGVSWGLFATDSILGFVLMGLLIGGITALLAYYMYARWQAGFSAVGELFIVAGSVGNLIDRLFYHGVIDFIRFSWGQFTWPIFNIADCCIVLGVFWVVMQKLKE